jgi:3-phytase
MSRSAVLDARTPAAVLLSLLLILGALVVSAAPVAADSRHTEPVRFATFNASLNRNFEGQALSDLSAPFNPAEADAALRLRRAQAASVAEIIQRVRPEVLLVNEFDYVDGPLDGNALTDAFQANYLSVPQQPELEGITYPYVFVAPSNTGIHSGFDLNNNGAVVSTPLAFGYGDDALGFGEFPGKFGMAVFSQHPIRYSQVRTFQDFKWADMPGALLPTYPATWPVAELRGLPWYTDAELAVLPLSSKSHWDIPIRIGNRTVHFLASHPTPPVFDGDEDRNGRRNFDEIRLWADYIKGGKAAGYIYDDDGKHGGLKAGESFVIAGDQNSDPLDGDSRPGAIQQLLNSPLVNTSVTPQSAGATEASHLQGGANLNHRSDPRFDTADFADSAPGNLRADYVLPSSDLQIVDSAVFWPVQADPLFRLTGVFPFPSSDHRLVWVEVVVSDDD